VLLFLPSGKKVRVRAPGPALAGLTKPRHPVRPRSLLPAAAKMGGVHAAAIATKPKRAACASNGKSGVQERRLGERRLGERLAHLLALRPYTRPELILRLQRDGLTDAEKDRLDAELLEVHGDQGGRRGPETVPQSHRRTVSGSSKNLSTQGSLKNHVLKGSQKTFNMVLQ